MQPRSKALLRAQSIVAVSFKVVFYYIDIFKDVFTVAEFSRFLFYEILCISAKNFSDTPRRRGLGVSVPPATEETWAMGRWIESRQGIGW
jgi:hypothetical protein